MVTQIHTVANELRRRIASGVYPPGERLVELALAAELGASRTPIRLAFEELTKEGLLERLPTRGFRVKAFSADDLADAIDVRGTLEGMAARLAAERKPSDEQALSLKECVAQGRSILADAMADDQHIDAARWIAMNARFHSTLIEAAQNAALAAAVSHVSKHPLAGAQALSHGIAPRLEFALIQRAQQDHEDVVQSVLAGEGVRAEALMREHARRSRDNKRELLTGKHQPEPSAAPTR
jgi:GntR family transcriptional regulator, vanillate catabolism transcriptional regulator